MKIQITIESENALNPVALISDLISELKYKSTPEEKSSGSLSWTTDSGNRITLRRDVFIRKEIPLENTFTFET